MSATRHPACGGPRGPRLAAQERGLLDRSSCWSVASSSIFIADLIGIYDVLVGNGDAAIRQAAQVPVNDPLAVITPMALVTEHLGFGLTASLTFEHPYPFARRLSTLDIEVGFGQLDQRLEQLRRSRRHRHIRSVRAQR